MWLLNYLTFSLIFIANVCTLKINGTLFREKELIDLMNQSIKPCENFYEFSCGNFSTLYPARYNERTFNVFDKITEKNYEALDELLRKNIGGHTTAQDKAKVFYLLCNNMTQLNERGPDPVCRFLKDIAGLEHCLREFNKPDFNWIDLVINIHKSLNTNSLFEEKIELKKIVNNSASYLPVFNPPNLKLDNTEHNKNKLFTILKEFRFNDISANSKLNEYLEFYDDIEATKTFTYKTSETASISKFQEWVPEFDWHKFLHGVYGVHFSPDDEIRVSDVGYFQLLVCLLERKTPLQITNFVVFNAINELLPVLDGGFIRIKDKYDVVKVDSFLYRWRFCVDTTANLFNLPTAAILMSGKETMNSHKSIQEIENNIKDAFKDILKNSTWPTEDNINETLNKLNLFHTTLDWVDLIHDNTFMDKQYDALQVTNVDFFDAYINAMRLKNQQIGDIIRSNSTHYYADYKLVSGKIQNRFNNLEILPGLLQTFYFENSSKFLQYGSLGVMLAQEFFHSFDTIGAKINSTGHAEDWWSSNNTELFENRTSCFKTQYDNFEVHNVSLKDYPTTTNNIADYVGVKVASMAYEKILNAIPDKNYETIDGFTYTSTQLFYITAAQGLCSTLKPDEAQSVLEHNSFAPSPWRVNAIVQNLPHFSQQFNCPENSKMHPSNKCSVFE